MAKKAATKTNSDGFVSHADDPMLSYTEAGELIGRSNTTIKRWVNEGLLRSIRDPSGLPRIRKSELTKFYGASALADHDESKRLRDEKTEQEARERRELAEKRAHERMEADNRAFDEKYNPHLLKPVEATLVEEGSDG